VVLRFSNGRLNTSRELSAYTPVLSKGSAIPPHTASF